MANTIPVQPTYNSIKAVYRPIVFNFSVDVSVDDCPVAFCDIYINGIYYKSISRTQPVDEPTGFKIFQFDIQDACQEYLGKYLADNGGIEIVDAATLFGTVFCRFRNTTLDANGFVVSNGTAPIQATGSTAAVAGTGLPSNSFFVVNSTLQHADNQELTTHLDSYKSGTWHANIHPLSHRPPGCYIGLYDSDFFPVVNLSTKTLDCITLNYKLRNQTAFTSITYCPPAVAVCVPVSFISAPSIPGAVADVTYSATITLGGTAPFTLANIVKPSWMEISVVGSSIVFGGMPAPGDVGTDFPVEFDVQNTCGTLAFADTVDVIASGSCVDVAIVGTPDLPNATVGAAYSYSFNLTGSTPFSLTNVVKPSWMTITVVGSSIVFGGTPPFVVDPPDAVSFDIENCLAGSVSFSDIIDITPAPPVPTCTGYINNTGAPVTGISYTHCGGAEFTNVTIANGQEICVLGSTLTGANAYLLNSIGSCSPLVCMQYSLTNSTGSTQSATYQQCDGSDGFQEVLAGGSVVVCTLTVPVDVTDNLTIYQIGYC